MGGWAYQQEYLHEMLKLLYQAHVQVSIVLPADKFIYLIISNCYLTHYVHNMCGRTKAGVMVCICWEYDTKHSLLMFSAAVNLFK